MGDELPVLLVEKLTIQGDQRENHEDAENLPQTRYFRTWFSG